MPKWWYKGMSYPLFFSAIACGLMQFIDGFPWGYVSLAFAVAGHYYLARFNHLHKAAPEE